MKKKELSLKDVLTKVVLASVSAAITVFIGSGVFFTIAPLLSLEQRHIDERFVSRTKPPSLDSSDVIILEITQSTYDGIPAPYNSWPWPRSVFAQVIKNLNEAGVKAIGIDIVMANADKFSPVNDSILIEAIRYYGNVVVAGKIDNRSAETGGENSAQVVINKINENYNSRFFQADSSIGIVQVASDADGIHRRYFPFMFAQSTEQLVPTFAFALLNKFKGLPKNSIADRESEYFVLGTTSIPKFDDLSMLVNFYGPNRTFQHVDLIDVLDGADFTTTDELELETEINTWDDPDFRSLFKDKIVIIGSTMPEDRDVIPVSIGEGKKEGDNQMYGVEFHANAVQNVINRDFIDRMPTLHVIMAIVLLSFFTVFISSIIKEYKTAYGLLLEVGNLVLVILMLAGLRELSLYLFSEFHYLFLIVPTSLSVVVSYFSVIGYFFVTERKQKTMIKGMFGKYVDASIVDQLILDPERLKLGGDKKELTVFFSDIAGFSTFSEKKSPEELVSFLNEYLSAMTRIVIENKGTLDKYIGDAIMAFWGAPLPLDDHAYLACKTVLLQAQKVEEMRKKWREEGQPEIIVRFGINTGEMVVGNVGGSERFDYTVMGDNVNLGSRLEGANKEYGTTIMMSESTYEKVKDRCITRELDKIVVKGKTQPVAVYELIALVEDVLPESKVKTLEFYCKGLELYKAKDFDSALEQFNLALATDPSDKPSEVYAERCTLFLQTPPPPDWDGVFRLTRK